MNKDRTRISLFALAGIGFTALAITACQPAEGPAERAGKQLDNAAERVGNQVDDAAERAKKKVENATN